MIFALPEKVFRDDREAVPESEQPRVRHRSIAVSEGAGRVLKGHFWRDRNADLATVF